MKKKIREIDRQMEELKFLRQEIQIAHDDIRSKIWIDEAEKDKLTECKD